jgi:hypothetical protein
MYADREATLRARVRGERGVVDDGDGADDGQSEAVVVVDAGGRVAGLEEAMDLLGRDHRPGVRAGPLCTMRSTIARPLVTESRTKSEMRSAAPDQGTSEGVCRLKDP